MYLGTSLYLVQGFSGASNRTDLKFTEEQGHHMARPSHDDLILMNSSFHLPSPVVCIIVGSIDDRKLPTLQFTQ